MRGWSLALLGCLLWLAGCGNVEPTPTARPRADQVSTATAVAQASEATQTARAATATAAAQPTATATPTEVPTATPTHTATRPRPTMTPTPTPTPRTITTPVPGANGAAGKEDVVILDDDLTRLGPLWYGMGVDCGGSTIACQDEAGLHLRLPDANKWIKGAHKSFPDATNVVVDLTVQLVSNKGDLGGVGILCRYQTNGDGYVLNVWGDGYYSIARIYRGTKVYLDASDEPHPAIATGLAQNTLHFECIDDTFVIEANGEELVRYIDDVPDFAPGQMMFYLCTCRGGSIEAVFTHVKVTLPGGVQPSSPTRNLPTRVSNLPPLQRPTLLAIS